MSRSFLLVLVLAVFGTALGVVVVRHESRKSFVELQELEGIRDAMNEEWGRLQLEQATWATHGRVEDIARSKLAMKRPEGSSLVVVTR